MRKTENISNEAVPAVKLSENEIPQSENEVNLNSLALAAGNLCDVVVAACKNRSQFKENAEKGKRAKTDIKSVKEMCAVLKELTAIMKNFDCEPDAELEQANVLEVIFGEGGDKYAI